MILFRSHTLIRKIVISFAYVAPEKWIILPCPVQYFKTIRQLKHMFWANDISRGLNLRLVSDGYPVLHSTQAVI